MDQRGLLEETLVVAVGEFGRSPQKGISTSGNNNSADGRDHWPYCYTAVLAGAGVKRGYVHGRSDATGSAPLDDAVAPLFEVFHGEILAALAESLLLEQMAPHPPALRAGALSPKGEGRHEAIFGASGFRRRYLPA